MRLLSFLAGLAATLAVACFTDSGGDTLDETSGPMSAGESTGASAGASTSGASDTSTAPTSTTGPNTGDPTSESDSTTNTTVTTNPTNTSAGCMMDPCCGDGEISTGEQCDDGNDVEDDFCTASCERRALRVFVTSKKWAPGGGLADADAFCQKSANSALLPGSYVAWLSSSTVAAIDRVGQNNGLPIHRLDAAPVFANPGDLGSGSLLAAIAVDESGALVDVPPVCSEANAVWTGSTVGGASSGNHCTDWTLTMGGSGSTGYLTATDTAWTENGCQIDCVAPARLYCFEVG